MRQAATNWEKVDLFDCFFCLPAFKEVNCCHSLCGDSIIVVLKEKEQPFILVIKYLC